MEKSVQIQLANELAEHLKSNTTAMADGIYRNRVSQYVCPNDLARERETLFAQPIHVAFSCDIPKPGDYLTDDFSGVPILVVRDEEGHANAFLNVCRHRGAPVASGCGKGQKRFVCPYHAWVYNTRGELERIPSGEGFEELDRATHGLQPLPIAEKYGMIWVKTAPGGPFEIDDYLGGVESDLATYGFDKFHHFDTQVLRPKMNWKLVVDTFLETYHVRVLHRDTIDPLIHSNVSTFDAFGQNLRGIYARKNFDEMPSSSDEDWSLFPYTTVVYVMFPNTVLIVQQKHIETWRIYPDGDDPNASKMHVSIYTPDDSRGDERATRHWEKNMELLLAVVNSEDFPLGEKMQMGFHSAAQEHLTFGRNEPALRHFHESVEAALTGAAPV